MIFSDEKKWNLDGPDGFSAYWRDLRKEERIFSKRQMGGGSVMTWAAITYLGRLALVFVEGRLDSNRYQALLSGHVLPLLNQYPHLAFMFQQDNASIHASHSTTRWFDENNVPVLKWPAKSPDLNIIENVWSFLARDVYNNARQFDSIQQLKNAIQDAWNRLSREQIHALYRSCHRRIIEVIQRNGNVTHY